MKHVWTIQSISFNLLLIISTGCRITIPALAWNLYNLINNVSSYWMSTFIRGESYPRGIAASAVCAIIPYFILAHTLYIYRWATKYRAILYNVKYWILPLLRQTLQVSGFSHKRKQRKDICRYTFWKAIALRVGSRHVIFWLAFSRHFFMIQKKEWAVAR